MTDADILKAFTELEAAGRKTPQGQDYYAICWSLSRRAGKPMQYVVDLVLTDRIPGGG